MFNHLSVENGLSTSSVLSIAKDSRGVMWFGTKNGLNKFNTINFKIYKSNTGLNSLNTSTWIFDLLSDTNNHLWIATEGGLNRYLPESDSFQHILSDKKQSNSLSDNYVNCLYEDSKKTIWVGTANGLNELTSLNPARFRVFFKDLPTGQKTINTLFEDSRGRLWIGTAKGLIRMDRMHDEHHFNYYYHGQALNTLTDDFITSITEDQKGHIWIGTKSGGLDLFNEQLQVFTRINYSSEPNSLYIRKIVVDKLGNLWIGTLNGLIIFNPVTKAILHFKNDPNDPYSLSNNSIKDIYFNNDGSVWIATMYGGINVLYSFSVPFNAYRYDGLPGSISSNIVSAIAADKNKLWIGTDGEGLNLFNPDNGSFKQFKSDHNDPNSLNSNFVKTIYKDKEGNVWVGTLDAGLGLFNPLNNTFKHFVHEQGNASSLNSDNISDITEDAGGRLLIGTGNDGLNIFDRHKGTFQIVNTSTKCRLSSNIVKDIFEDTNHNCWVATADGLNLFSDGFKKNTAFFKNNTGLKSNYIYCIFEDHKKNLWFGTRDGGLSLYHPETGGFSTFTTADGLVSNSIYGILEDNAGMLWLSTDHGLSRLDPYKKIFTTYDVSDGLPGNEFNSGAYKDKNGRLYFGSYNGLINFQPSQIQENDFTADIIFTDLKLFNKKVDINGTDGLLKKDISLTKQITFTHDQNIFTIDFALLNYLRSSKNKYAYKLQGFEKNWNYVNVPLATYTNLPAGNYTFLVKGANNDSKWTTVPARIMITILPPVWKTWWAYCTYIICASGITFGIIRFLKIRAGLKRDLYLKARESKQQDELYQMKLDFFTNISHEIRTPLTLIIGPLEQLLESNTSDTAIKVKIKGIKNNADRLLRLVKELLEFRRADTGHLKLQLITGDIVAFAHDIYIAFESMAAINGIAYEFIAGPDRIGAQFDPDQLEKALFNIISNAFKFTPAGGTITISVRTICLNEAALAEIKVYDTGKGIAPCNLEHIFDNFCQANAADQLNGTGIGLAYAKKIVELHGGDINVSSSVMNDDAPGKTCFTVTIPLYNKTDLASIRPVTSSAPHYINTNSTYDKRYSLLVIEDNPEVSDFLKEALEEAYIITVKNNGLDGWETAITEIPDIIISDVMMPVMDGFELLARLKNDERTNHIPVILLTARASDTYQLTGLDIGADAYIVKPFSVEVLKLNIRNFILLREAFRKEFSKGILGHTDPLISVTEDDKFLKRLMDIIEDQIANTEFDVACMTSEMGMSKNILYKKVLSLTGYTIADLVKYTRLKKAGTLLLEKKLTICEVAFSVGFNDRKYFSKEFRKLFGNSPSGYQQQAGPLTNAGAFADSDDFTPIK